MWYLKKNSWYAILVLICTACASTSPSGPLYEKKQDKIPGIPLRDFKIEIIDSRKNVLSREIEIPVETYPGQIKDIFSPKITIDLEQAYSKLVENNKINGDKKIIIKVEIIKAFKRYEVGIEHKLYVYVELDIKIFEQETGKILFNGKRFSWGLVKPMFLKNPDQASEIMFNDALIKAFTEALESIKL